MAAGRLARRDNRATATTNCERESGDMKLSKKALSIGILGAVTAAIVTGCASPQFDDLKNVNPVLPDYATVIMNVDGFPNISLVCYHGIAMVTTTRNMDSTQFQPAYNPICKEHMK